MWQHLQELEQDLLAEETQLPVYFTHETPELMSVYDDISKTVSANSAGSAAEGEVVVCTVASFTTVDILDSLVSWLLWWLRWPAIKSTQDCKD